MTTLLPFFLAATVSSGWIVVGSHELERPSEPATLSGITHVSNDTYLAATDWNPTLYELTIPLDSSARPLEFAIVKRGKLDGCLDVEDVASDPTDRSFVFAVDERRGIINRHSVTGGIAVSSFKPSGTLAHTRLDVGMESLAVSRDGMTFWTANEEAAEADGPLSSRKRGTDVRLSRFRRTDRGGSWKADGEWLYQTDPIAGSPWKSGESDASRSGLSALCLMEDGTLLALEREFSVVFLPRFRCRVYEINLTGATDVSAYASTTNVPVTRVAKRLLHETKGRAMYEGLCEGPRLKDGSSSLILVSDGDHRFMAKSIMTLKLKKR